MNLRRTCRQLHYLRRTIHVLILCLLAGQRSSAQQAPEIRARVDALSRAVDRVQAQIEASQRELIELHKQLDALRTPESAGNHEGVEEPKSAEELASAVAAIRETQAMQQTQIATLSQSKVESESKYPVKVTGLVLMTGFANPQGVDDPRTPSVAFTGTGSTGATIRQTQLGISARGPHVFGGESHAAVEIDFNGSASLSTSSGNYSAGLVRLRTAAAELAWQDARAFFTYDRPMISPHYPTSLTAVALPALSWSGNLWAWNPQLGIERDWFSSHPTRLRTQLALIGVADPPMLYSASQPGNYVPPSTTELSRWPGIEGRLAMVSGQEESGLQLGLGGLYAPHRTAGGTTFDSWVASVDLRVPIVRAAQLSGTFYRGQALGGLGAGTYKDYVARIVNGEYYYRALEDYGGWMQLKERLGPRLELNQAAGGDNVPAGQLRPFAIATPVNYYNLARNRTLTANFIYSPSAYVLLSLEYRRIASSYVTSGTRSSDVIGLAAGYRF